MSQHPFPPSGLQRRGLPQLSTTSNPTSYRSNQANNDSPQRSSFPPINSTSNSQAYQSQSATRQNLSRTSSVSSNNSSFPTQSSGLQQPPASQLLSSFRSRNIPSSNPSQLPSSTAASVAAPYATSGAIGGGGPSRLARGSPSLSQSSGVSSPIVASGLNSLPSAGQQQQGLNKIVVAQIFLLLSGLNSEKDKAKKEQAMENIQTLVGQHDAEVFSKYFRRLVMNNASHIFASSGRNSDPSGSYPILQGEMRKVRFDSKQTMAVADALNTTEGDIFRDLDVSALLDHFKFDDTGKYAFAVYLKSSPKADLRVKAENILAKTFAGFVAQISQPVENGEDVPIPYLRDLLDRLLQEPPKGWTEDSRQNFFFAIVQRYQKLNMMMPREILSTMHLADLLGSTSPLVRLMHRTGPRVTSSLDACKDALANAEIRDINYTQVASVLLFMIIAQNGQAYNPSIFVAALREHRSGKRLDWQDVVHAFDRESLVVTKSQFLSLYSALLPLAQEYENFDLQLLWGGLWQNVDTQLSFVVAFLSCTSEELDALAIPRLRKTSTLDMFEDAPADVKTLAADAVKHPLVSLDAVEALFRIVFASQDAYATATRLGIPETVINPHTDYFVLSVAAVPKPWGPVQEQAFKQLFTPFLRKQIPGDRFVFHGMWKRDARWLAARLVDAFQASPLVLEFIFQHAIDHDWLDSLLQTPSQFSVDLAALAHSEGRLDIDAWLTQTNQVLPEIFPKALVEFIDQKAQMEQRLARATDISPTSVPLAVKTVVAFLGFLQPHLPDEHLIPLLRVCINAFPRIINYGEGFDEVIDANGRSGNAMTQEADANMQEHFKKMYNKESDVRSIVESLRHFKQSEDPAEQDLFACMIAGLFDEYHCFPEYPQEALATTAVLFGSIINFNLLSSIPLQAALAMVLEAVQGHSSDTKMFKFGLEALSHFRSRLHEWPSFCERLLQVPELQNTEIWPIAQNAVRSNNIDDRRNGASAADRNGDTQGLPDMPNGLSDDYDLTEPSAPAFTCLSADAPLRPEIYEDPDEDVRDKVLFILNNVSARNLNEKLKTLKDTLEQKHHQWFASYLVDERAKLQPNFQQLYLDMLEQFSDKNLWNEVLRETYRACVDILNAPSTKESSIERGNMKNLAGWLGSLTLARDKPIKYRNICFRDLLLEAHHTSRLIVVIPFTCKVLLQAARSKVFKPPNPWTMEIVGVLVELYLHGGADMKLQLKFEVEVLCKDLNLDMETLKQSPSTFIRDSLIPVHEDQSLLQHPEMVDSLDGFGDITLGMSRPRVSNDRFSPQTILDQIPEDLAGRIQYPPFQTPGMDQETMRTIFTQAARSSILEIIVPVVERSVTIAAIATAQLVTKDYATEADIEKLRKAAMNLVGKLAGSLADVTCKEPLRMSMTNNLRTLGRDTSGDQLAEGVVIMFVNDNIEMACKIIQHAAEEAAAQEIEGLLQDGIRARQAHGNLHNEEPFCWPSVSKYAYAISEPFRPANYGGLKPEQLSIYENFQAVRTASSHNQTPSADNRPMNDMMHDQFSAVNALQVGPDTPNMLRQGLQPARIGQPQGFGAGIPPAQANGFTDPSQISHKVDFLLEELGKAMKDAPEEHVQDLGRDSATRDAFTQLLQFIDTNHVHRDGICNLVAGKAFAALYSELERRLEVEVLVQLLHTMAAMSPPTARQVDGWIASLEGPRLFKPVVTPCLVMTNLLAASRLDQTVAEAMREGKPFAIDFFADMVEELLLSNQTLILRTEFAQSLEVLTQIATESPEASTEKSILTKLEVQMPSKVDEVKDNAQAEQLELIFDEWVQLNRQSAPPKMLTAFVSQLNKQDLLLDREATALFLRVCIDTSIERYEHEEMNPLGGTIDAAYLHVDALAHLLMVLMMHHSQPITTASPTAVDKARYLDYLLSLVVIVQAHHQQTRGERVNQKVFYRLYASLLCQMADLPEDLQPAVLAVFGSAFSALQPAFFPGFTFAWVSLISHRLFMPKMIGGREATQRVYTSLLTTVFSYLDEMNKQQQAPLPMRALNSAMLRVMLVLSHDYPSYVAANHVELLAALPTRFTQLRNLVISAVPESFTELPEPYMGILDLEPSSDMKTPPPITWDFASILKKARVQKLLDDAVASNGSDISAITQVCQVMSGNQAMTQAVVLSIANAITKTSTWDASKAAELIKSFLEQLVGDARYSFLCTITNQLRYPNTHTHLYSSVILQLFAREADTPQDIKIQIVRVLLEYLLVQGPHSWGVVATFFHLYQTVEPQFWAQFFSNDAPESNQEILNNVLNSARRDWRLGQGY